MFSPGDLARRFSPLEKARGVLIAVSGGPDSVALMLLAREWANANGAAVPLATATVDHGLRRESRQEAEAVARWAQALGLPHQILSWGGEKPKTAVQERARRARYALLFEHAQAIGADHVMTAHHADDQAETVLFRLLRGSGVAGLAGMPRASRRGAVVHLRPLLDCPKDALVGVCEKQGHPYFNDPSNKNMVFARARLRQLAPLLAAEGLDRAALLRLGARAARADRALTDATEARRAALQALRGDRLFRAQLAGFAETPEEIFIRLLAIEFAALGAKKPLRVDRLERLAAALQEALRDATPWRGSLAGMRVDLDRAGVLTIRPEALRRRGHHLVHAGENQRPLGSDSPPSQDPITSG